MYSTIRQAARRQAEIIADLSQVPVRYDGREAASHPRSWARHQTIIETGHLAGAGVAHTGRR